MVYSLVEMGWSVDLRRLLLRLSGSARPGAVRSAPAAPWDGAAPADPGDPDEGWFGEGSLSDERPAPARRPGHRETALGRSLRGDRTALQRVANDLVGSDHAQADRLERLLEAFVEAILQGALEAGVVYPSQEHPFWARFTPDQGRRILDALASMGFRFDGMGGWQDGRAPVRRDLVLAVGVTGVDAVRIHAWPVPSAMSDLLRDTTIDGEEYLASVAPTLKLTDLATALGPRAIPLAEFWLHLERARPLLLAET